MREAVVVAAVGVERDPLLDDRRARRAPHRRFHRGGGGVAHRARVPTGTPGSLALVPDFADDTSSELERKARALKFMALFETVTYLLLFYFWIVSPNDAIKASSGSSTAWCGWRSWR